MKQILSLLLFVTVSCGAIPRRRELISEWDYRLEANKANTRGCSNLTVVLDNWKFAIVTQIRNLLLHDHQIVLPDYGRIKPLSDALDDLYKEFNVLQGHLGELTKRFEEVESFVDEMSKRQKPSSAKPSLLSAQLGAEKVTAPLPAKRRRILIRNGRRIMEPRTEGRQ